jgi:hypothetical protein
MGEAFSVFEIPDEVVEQVASVDDVDIVREWITEPICIYVDRYIWNNIEERRYIYDYAEDYGEPGYDSASEKGILLGDWNRIPNAVQELFEECGYNLEWHNEWFVYCDESLAYRLRPDSYDWEPSFFVPDCEILPIEHHTEEYVEYVMDSIDKLAVSTIDLEEFGFEEFRESCYESGMYGRNDNPERILEAAAKEVEFEHFIFQACSTEQFRITFKLMIKRGKENA